MLDTIRSLGGDLVVVSPQLPEFLRELKAKQGLGFDLLHDQASAVAERFGLAVRLPDDLIEVYKRLGVDLVKFNGDQLWRLPIPARFVIDRAGTVRAAEADPDYTTRPEVEDTLSVLRAIA
ncbi:MAG: redoxin domain-containing protein [Acetobacteraceae bacterium]|nr:redoxin domain-containing protein [Acetobacteraceae bacterium]